MPVGLRSGSACARCRTRVPRHTRLADRPPPGRSRRPACHPGTTGRTTSHPSRTARSCGAPSWLDLVNPPMSATSTGAIVAIRPRAFHGISGRPHIGMSGRWIRTWRRPPGLGEPAGVESSVGRLDRGRVSPRDELDQRNGERFADPVRARPRPTGQAGQDAAGACQQECPTHGKRPRPSSPSPPLPLGSRHQAAGPSRQGALAGGAHACTSSSPRRRSPETRLRPRVLLGPWISLAWSNVH